MIKFRQMREARYLAYTDEMGNVHRISIRRPEEKSLIGDLGINGMIIL
jgi:hypothetical protein